MAIGNCKITDYVVLDVLELSNFNTLFRIAQYFENRLVIFVSFNSFF